MLRLRDILLLVCCLAATAAGVAADAPVQLRDGQTFAGRFQVPTENQQRFALSAGDAIGINVRIAHPSRLPDNARLRAHWRLVEPTDANSVPRADERDGSLARAVDVHGIYTAPTADWSKLLHALDGDVFLNYRAPVAGIYALQVAPAVEKVDLFEGPRWREPGKAPQITPVPQTVTWPAGERAEVLFSVSRIDVTQSAVEQMWVELEPNDTPEQAQPIELEATTDETTLHVIGSADDIEYFDNGRVGSSGDDWFRLDFAGPEARLLTACLSIPDQQVAARIRVFRIDPKQRDKFGGPLSAGRLLPIVEYTDGKNENERSHQQEEQHRIAVNRNLQPGETYFLRVEANAPGYDLELRVVKPAPYQDPRRSIRQGLYDHLGQVDAWIANRPRGASVERRIRDSGNLLGTNCMSCHTQSGVWGPAIPFAMGYRPQNVQLWRHLVNTCYQSLRPTNHLKDAANNTSLQPLDLGDGPAGTRVAGHAVVSLERFLPARKLQGMQARRCANFVLLTGDPGGINAAGPGANVGQGVVFNYAGEIVWTAWRETGEPKYFHALEDKARRMLKIDVKFCDDLGHRVEFFGRYFPSEYVAAAARVADQEQLPAEKKVAIVQAAAELAGKVQIQVAADLARLRGIQLAGGGWSFDPGKSADGGQTWEVKDQKADPSPTSLSLIAFQAAGVGRHDATVTKGIQALLGLQHPTGLWKVASQTGFVSTSYALHALSRYFPAIPEPLRLPDFDAPQDETLLAAIGRVRAMSVREDPRLVPQLIDAAGHPSPLVRYWAMIGLGATHSDAGALPLARGLGDPTKMVREAAHWGLRQTLIDDRGWSAVMNAAGSPDDYVREAAMRALVMKVDSVLPQSVLSHQQLVATLDQALNRDAHPGVRAWATRAAWQWWVWNPPVRSGLNDAWIRMLSRPETNALVENAIRYQSHALFIANGHVANGSKDHQYPQLAQLFANIDAKLEAARGAEDPSLARRLTKRLMGIAATFHNQRGGDGGPGQMGYVTPGATDLFGKAILEHLEWVEAVQPGSGQQLLLQTTLEGSANIPLEKLQQKLVDYSINGPEQFRALAASSISDPRLVSLIAVPEQLEPMYRQLLRGAAEPPRRKDLSDPILKMFASVHWILPQSDEQREEILQFMVPDLTAYRSAAELEKIADPAERATAARESDAAWYLAEGLGRAVADNPDLHFEHLAEVFPDQFSSAAQARYWIASVPWILEFQRKLPEVKIDPKKLPPVDPYEELRTRALALFLTQLEKEVDPRNRKVAANLTNKTALRRNPEVLTALNNMLEFEKEKEIVENAKKVLSQNNQTFVKDLAAALKAEQDHGFKTDDQGNPQPPQEFVNDLTYFRDYVVPEMTKVLRGDERSCMICHGEPGRVPSMELWAPDQVGFLPVGKLLTNYRVLQQRVDLEALENSKLLRKPLNVQNAKEEGHQGGRRYQPSDPGYQILRRWATSQIELQKRFGKAKTVVLKRQ
ncbi:MAG: hypothetical protein CMJ59_17480 [Planctomycetaceae bacterium]|nr:hypothetical protein [Planctomycetaceae bacterium]